MWNTLTRPLQLWWQSNFARPEPVVAPLVFRPPAARLRPPPAAARVRPVTPFRAPAVGGARRAAKRFWMTLDPQDRRRAAIGGSFAEVCAALERLAAVEERSAAR